jgi:hypothetical protein
MRPTGPWVDPSALASRRPIRWIASLCVGVLALSVPFALRAASPMQRPGELFMPSLQADLRYETADASIAGQEGFGAAIVDAQNLSDAPNDVTLDLEQQTGGDPASLHRQAEPMAVTRFDLESERSLEGGYYAGRSSCLRTCPLNHTPTTAAVGTSNCRGVRF